MREPAPALDASLLSGVEFACRPDCGLCCYASPALSEPERVRLIQIAPELDLRGPPGAFTALPAHPNGGSCVLLRSNRCTQHPDRPFPCRAFPLLTHIGRRAQMTVVLACPGVTLASPETWGRRGVPPQGSHGLEGEVAESRREAATVPLARWLEESAGREERLLRRARPALRPADVDRLRASVRENPPGPDPTGEVALPPPRDDRPLEELPLFFDEKLGRVALGVDEDGRYSAVTLRERGGLRERLGSFEVARGVPRVDPEAANLLTAYQRHLVDRDHFLWSAYHEIYSGAEPDVGRRLKENLREVATEVLRRASVRRMLQGEDGTVLGRLDILAGIRATDADVLDRPTFGRIL